MPGMDGFQAVQAIKSDAQTATIPLMMYTSQEGELYVSQARALGAVGVLPKTVRPVDVSRVLYQLHLLPDRRQDRTTLFQRGESGAGAGADVVGCRGRIARCAAGPGRGRRRPSSRRPLPCRSRRCRRRRLSELSAGAATIGAAAREGPAGGAAPLRARHLRGIRASPGLGDEGACAEGGPSAPSSTCPRPSRRDPGGGRWSSRPCSRSCRPASSGSCTGRRSRPAARSRARSRGSRRRWARLRRSRHWPRCHYAAVAPQPSPGRRVGPAVRARRRATAARAGRRPRPRAAPVEYVPYGDVPFGGARLERLRDARLDARGAATSAGRIVARIHGGGFLPHRQPGGGIRRRRPVAAAQEVRHRRQSRSTTALSPAQRQSVDFANFAATLRRRSGGAIAVDTVDAGRRSVVEYPEQTETTTAGAWNTIAAQNNRVEIRVVPAE